MPFIWQQNSLTERSPWTKVRKLASSRRARASALPRNWPSGASPGPASAWSVADEVVEVQRDHPQNPGENDAVEA